MPPKKTAPSGTVTTKQNTQRITDADIKRRFVVVEQEWSEVKHVFMRGISDNVTDWPTQPAGQGLLKKWAAAAYENDSFYGDKPANTANYVRNGYRAEEFSHAAEGKHIVKKPRFEWDEADGECDVQQLLAGSDTPFLNLVRKESKPGIRLEIDFSFNCSVRAQTIRDYGAWVAGLIAGLETSGYDLEVVFDMSGRNVWHGASGMTLRNFLIVKRFGEKSNFTDWSALFAPGGFRHLGFTAIPLACDKLGKTCTSGLGQAFGSDGWGVTWTPENSLLRITAEQHAGSKQFPAQKLTNAALETGLL